MNGAHIPADVSDWVRLVFARCNERITGKLGRNPNAPEESFDLTWLEHLTHVASPIRLGSGWTVRIQTHYLGGMRHFRGWEIADIGVLMFIRDSADIRTSKVALLQSKRLYPRNMVVAEEVRTDYEIGFARLADPEDLAHSIAFASRFEFNRDCRYGALIAHSEQTGAITDYEREVGLPVYYQFYNPWRLPYAVDVPIRRITRHRQPPALGVRIYPSAGVHAMLSTRPDGVRPTYTELIDACGDGWALDAFVADELLGCREGHIFDSPEDAAIQTLFNRRSGPIAAAISITLEAPEPLD
jgi:hypothetical protein